MFFLIAGVTPKIIILDEKPKLCASCGLDQAYLKRVDYYFNIFFIPIVKVKKGETFLECNTCNDRNHDFEKQPFWSKMVSNTCNGCGKTLEKDFIY